MPTPRKGDGWMLKTSVAMSLKNITIRRTDPFATPLWRTYPSIWILLWRPEKCTVLPVESIPENAQEIMRERIRRL